MSLPTLDAWSLVLVAVVAAALFARLRPPAPAAFIRRVADGPGLPLIAAGVSVALLWYLWGGLDPVRSIHDEAAYLLQAEMLGRGHFAAAPRPLPDFFEQFHLFVTPVLAARYPPGFALALVPGVWLGVPALMPMLLTGATAALLVLLVRRLADPATALLAWVLWAGAAIELRFRPMFLSEHLSTFLWLVTFWALWRWRDDRRTRWLVIVAVAIAWDGITRPLTAFALAIPVGVVVLTDLFRSRLWRQLIISAAAGLLVCSLVPVQNQAVTGRWDRTPIWLYSDLYTPYDAPGLGLNTTRPQIPETRDRRDFGRFFRRMHADHVAERLPEILAQRVRLVFSESAAPWGKLGFGLLLLCGVIGAGAPIAFAASTGMLLMGLYLWYAHPPTWTVYYLEAHLIMVAAVALGARRLSGWVARAPSAPALLVLAAFAAVQVPMAAAAAKADRATTAAPHEALRRLESTLPTPAILFIRYAPSHTVHRGLIENRFDLDAAPVWRVHDLGPRNAELIAFAPDRIPFLFDEASVHLLRLAPDGVTQLLEPGP